MNKKDHKSKSQVKIRFHIILTSVILTISFLSLWYDLFAYSEIKSLSDNTDLLAKGIYIGLIPKLLLYFIFLNLIRLILKSHHGVKYLSITNILLGIISLFGLIFGLGALSDIGKDYLTGISECNMEWSWLYISLIFHILFYLFTFVLIIKSLKSLDTKRKENIFSINETAYEITQYIGIVCSVIGIGFILFAHEILGEKLVAESRLIISILLAYITIIILPYLTIMIYWLLKLNRRSNKEFYDEKQKYDILKSGFWAYMISILFLLLYYCVNLFEVNSISVILWFPLTVFLTLFIFSILALYNFKKN